MGGSRILNTDEQLASACNCRSKGHPWGVPSMYLVDASSHRLSERETGVLPMQSHSPMLYWCSVYARLGSSTSSYVCTAADLYGTRNKFLPLKEGNLWWNQGSKETNARYILCVSFIRDKWFSRFLWYISGTSVHATWVGQTILTCSGTCTPKWRHVSNHVELLWGYK